MEEFFETYIQKYPDTIFKTISIDRFVISINDECCVLKLVRIGEKEFHTELDELKLQPGCDEFSGNQYLTEIDRFVQELYTHFNYTGNLYIPQDVATIETLMPKITMRSYALRWRGSDDEFCTIDFQDKPVLQSFYENVIRYDYPDMFNGKMIMTEVADFVHGLMTNEFPSIVEELIIRMWYVYVAIPQVENEFRYISKHPGKFSNDIVKKYTGPRKSHPTLQSIPFTLSLFNVLTTDDMQTWYMRRLGLVPCETRGGQPNLEKLESVKQRVRQIQESPMRTIIRNPTQLKYFQPILDVPIRDVVTAIVERSKRGEVTYYDTVVYDLIDGELSTTKTFKALTQYVCKTIHP